MSDDKLDKGVKKTAKSVPFWAFLFSLSNRDANVPLFIVGFRCLCVSCFTLSLLLRQQTLFLAKNATFQLFIGENYTINIHGP